MRIERAADMRYFGQAWEVRVEVPSGQLTRAAADAGVENFHAVHEQVYGFSYRPSARSRARQGHRSAGGQGRQRVEWVNLRVTGVGPMRRPPVPAGVQLLGIGRARCVRAVARSTSMAPGSRRPSTTAPGSASETCWLARPIVEEHGSTTVVFPGRGAAGGRLQQPDPDRHRSVQDERRPIDTRPCNTLGTMGEWAWPKLSTRPTLSEC